MILKTRSQYYSTSEAFNSENATDEVQVLREVLSSTLFDTLKEEPQLVVAEIQSRIADFLQSLFRLGGIITSDEADLETWSFPDFDASPPHCFLTHARPQQ